MRRRVRGGARLRYLTPSGFWPSGHRRYYYRRTGCKLVPMPDAAPDDPVFLAAYAAAHGGPARIEHATGSIGATVIAYLRSDAYLSLAPSTRAVRRRALDDISQRYGRGTMNTLGPIHIRTDLARLDPHPANNRLRAWAGLTRWAFEAGLIAADPCVGLRKRRVPASDGHVAWTRADVAAFRECWPYGTPQRLAMELMHRTCASIGGMVRLGPGMVTDGWLTYTRGKSGTPAVVPMTAATAPGWFEHDDHLSQAIAATPDRHMTYLVTGQGRTKSAKSAASWFSRACREAGIEAPKSAHGIRKHRIAIFRENGATPDQRMAVGGHESKAMSDHYARSADLRKIVSRTPSANPVQTFDIKANENR